ncbi:tetratricopeptide repeat protein 1 [Ipomoea triloba]|uniref:tetratricopeptide repeat protein 1 n=1 Tax=Ipomoea triloba TaxID=35885 RepID=UPI00125D1946|nr:tetratricopeptide repeat protein 1 [Ipomoea triloba]
MVLIEPVPSSDETSKPKPPPVKAAEASTDAGSSSAPAAASGYGSDGYETASDTELNETDEAEGKKEEQNLSHSSVKDEKAKEDYASPATSTPSSSSGGNEEAPIQKMESDMDQLHEKAMALANDLKLEGNTLFRDGLHEEALSKYELALQAVKDAPSSSEIQAICHANRAACFSKLGKYTETINECTKALELNPTYVKALLRRAETNEKLEHYDEAIKDMTKILELEPSHDQARRAIVRLKPLADEKREKMKEEMIGKLKDMGNSILGKFGMSVDNFKAVKDPNTGSYSISFQK